MFNVNDQAMVDRCFSFIEANKEDISHIIIDVHRIWNCGVAAFSDIQDVVERSEKITDAIKVEINNSEKFRRIE